MSADEDRTINRLRALMFEEPVPPDSVHDLFRRFQERVQQHKLRRDERERVVAALRESKTTPIERDDARDDLSRATIGENVRQSASPLLAELETKRSVAACLQYLHETSTLKSAEVCREAGIHKTSYSTYVNGHTVPSEETLLRVADAFARELPELEDGKPARDHLFSLRAVQMRQIPGSLTGPESFADLVHTFSMLQEKRRREKQAAV